jgi:hypothetical protein
VRVRGKKYTRERGADIDFVDVLYAWKKEKKWLKNFNTKTAARDL